MTKEKGYFIDLGDDDGAYNAACMNVSVALAVFSDLAQGYFTVEALNQIYGGMYTKHIDVLLSDVQSHLWKAEKFLEAHEPQYMDRSKDEREHDETERKK